MHVFPLQAPVPLPIELRLSVPAEMFSGNVALASTDLYHRRSCRRRPSRRSQPTPLHDELKTRRTLCSTFDRWRHIMAGG